MPIRWHEEAPLDLREAIRFTGEETGFAPRLIEKDYFCSVILEALAEADVPLVVKGGTCLAKVHSGFFRLSEDLDFSIPTAPGSTRSDRSRAIAPVKEVIAALPTRIRGLEALTALEAPRGSVAAGRGHSRLLRHRPRGACRGARCRRPGTPAALANQARRRRHRCGQRLTGAVGRPSAAGRHAAASGAAAPGVRPVRRGSRIRDRSRCGRKARVAVSTAFGGGARWVDEPSGRPPDGTAAHAA